MYVLFLENIFYLCYMYNEDVMFRFIKCFLLPLFIFVFEGGGGEIYFFLQPSQDLMVTH